VGLGCCGYDALLGEGRDTAVVQRYAQEKRSQELGSIGERCDAASRSFGGVELVSTRGLLGVAAMLVERLELATRVQPGVVVAVEEQELQEQVRRLDGGLLSECESDRQYGRRKPARYIPGCGTRRHLGFVSSRVEDTRRELLRLVACTDPQRSLLRNSEPNCVQRSGGLDSDWSRESTGHRRGRHLSFSSSPPHSLPATDVKANPQEASDEAARQDAERQEEAPGQDWVAVATLGGTG
jgi:hypothetical protein